MLWRSRVAYVYDSCRQISVWSIQMGCQTFHLVQGGKRLEQRARIMLTLKHGRRFTFQSQHFVNGGLRGANGVLNSEHDIIGQFTELSNE